MTRDRTLLRTRASIFVTLVAGLWLYFSGFPLSRPVVWILAISTAVAILGALLLIERLPAERPQGKVTSRGRR